MTDNIADNTGVRKKASQDRYIQGRVSPSGLIQEPLPVHSQQVTELAPVYNYENSPSKDFVPVNTSQNIGGFGLLSNPTLKNSYTAQAADTPVEKKASKSGLIQEPLPVHSQQVNELPAVYTHESSAQKDYTPGNASQNIGGFGLLSKPSIKTSAVDGLSATPGGVAEKRPSRSGLVQEEIPRNTQTVSELSPVYTFENTNGHDIKAQDASTAMGGFGNLANPTIKKDEGSEVKGSAFGQESPYQDSPVRKSKSGLIQEQIQRNHQVVNELEPVYSYESSDSHIVPLKNESANSIGGFSNLTNPTYKSTESDVHSNKVTGERQVGSWLQSTEDSTVPNLHARTAPVPLKLKDSTIARGNYGNDYSTFPDGATPDSESSRSFADPLGGYSARKQMTPLHSQFAYKPLFKHAPVKQFGAGSKEQTPTANVNSSSFTDSMQRNYDANP